MSKKLLIILIVLIIALFLFLSCVGSSAQDETKASISVLHETGIKL